VVRGVAEVVPRIRAIEDDEVRECRQHGGGDIKLRPMLGFQRQPSYHRGAYEREEHARVAVRAPDCEVGNLAGTFGEDGFGLLEGDGAAECKGAYVCVEEPAGLRAHRLEKGRCFVLGADYDAFVEDWIDPILKRLINGRFGIIDWACSPGSNMLSHQNELQRTPTIPPRCDLENQALNIHGKITRRESRPSALQLCHTSNFYGFALRIDTSAPALGVFRWAIEMPLHGIV
jgi:hypothetical protein